MKKDLITWNNYQLAVEMIANEIKKMKQDNIHLVSIYRGSLVLGQHLSNKLNLPLSIGKFQKYDGTDKEFELIYDAGINKVYNNPLIIILDDLVDTGETLTKAKEWFNKRNFQTYSMVLFGEKFDDTHFGAFEKKPNWLVFPWEV